MVVVLSSLSRFLISLTLVCTAVRVYNGLFTQLLSVYLTTLTIPRLRVQYKPCAFQLIPILQLCSMAKTNTYSLSFLSSSLILEVFNPQLQLLLKLLQSRHQKTNCIKGKSLLIPNQKMNHVTKS